MPKHKLWFWVAALAAACLFDFLFWKKPFGISFVIWTAALLGLGFLLAWSEGKKPATASIILAVLILGFSFVPAWRMEPMTRTVSSMLTFGGMLLLSATFINGDWPFYRIWDYLKNLAIAIGGGFSRAILLGMKNSTPPPLDETVKKHTGSKGWAVVRGLLIAIPVVALLAILLSSADPVFSNWLKQILNLDKLPEYLFRLFYILMIGSFLVGIYLHAILPNKTEARPDPQSPWMKPFMGWTETAVILAAVDILFITFVFIQFRYLFGGSANISETGFSYADYARRGFVELVAVAVISLALYLCLNTVTRREGKGSKIGFTILSVLLLANVLVILASSLMRLLLYEDAYGFSQIRTYTHIFIFWLAGLIVVTMLLEILRKRGHFALALMVTIIGFGATLAILNVDGFITAKNISRSMTGEDLDIQYLVSLSSDAIPLMVEKFTYPATTGSVKEDLGYALACRQALTKDPTVQAWQGFNLSLNRSWQLLQWNKSAWVKFKVMNSDTLGWYYVKDGEDVSCLGYNNRD